MLFVEVRLIDTQIHASLSTGYTILDNKLVTTVYACYWYKLHEFMSANMLRKNLKIFLGKLWEVKMDCIL